MTGSTDTRISVNVRLNSQMADILGTNRIIVTVDQSSTVSDVKEEIKKNHPGIEIQLEGSLPVISGTMVNTDKVVEKGQEIAFLSPAAGG
ncbi:MAG: MoaD/ThiS family protein [Candidatus Neomarinimicrobiota bacterium]|nr:MoaD/ThiS family protein [Candidatus Neomarinimicrobiota bacterium]